MGAGYPRTCSPAPSPKKLFEAVPHEPQALPLNHEKPGGTGVLTCATRNYFTDVPYFPLGIFGRAGLTLRTTQAGYDLDLVRPMPLTCPMKPARPLFITTGQHDDLPA